MAALILYLGNRTSTDSPWRVSAYGIQTSTQFDMLDENGVLRDSETGTNFVYGGTGFFNGGTITGIRLFTGNGVLASEVSGATIDVATRNAILSAGNGEYAYRQYILRGDDRIAGSAFDDRILGSAGTDIINGGGGIDVISFNGFGEGVTVDLGARTAATGSGISRLFSIEDIEGSGFDDTLTGHGGNNQIQGFAGADFIDGGGGIDTAVYLDAVAGVEINLATGVVTGGSGNDTLVSIERIIGSRFSDLMNGSGANESFVGGFGDDAINGAGGIDTVEYGFVGSGVDVNLTTGKASGGAGNDIIVNVENIIGSIFNDTLVGNSAANVLDGKAGADSMSGADGSDTYVVDHSGDVVTETNATASIGGTDKVNSSLAAYTLGAHVENLTILSSGAANGTGNSLNNALIGNAGNNILDGQAGIDTVAYSLAQAGVTVDLGLAGAQNTQGAGIDTLLNFENLTGSGYNDTLAGNAAANTLTGGAGDDVLNGKAGNDRLLGGSGKDFFVFDTALNAAANRDRVVDFTVADDGIRLDDGVFARFAGSTVTAGNFVANAGGIAADADDYLLYDTATGRLYYDADGNGAGAKVPFVQFDNLPILGAGDFFIV